MSASTPSRRIAFSILHTNDMHSNFLLGLVALMTLVVVGPGTPAAAQAPAGKGDTLVAIDVLLQPDAALTSYASALNSRLRADYPSGYPLDGEQHAHVTLVQLIVNESDLPRVYEAVTRALDAGASPLEMPLTATGIDGAYAAGIGLAALVVEDSPALQDLHERIVRAVAPFGVQGATTAAFSTTPSLPTVSEVWVRYAEAFIREYSGEHYEPHVTLGVAHEAFIRQLAAEPFTPVGFQSAAVAVHQLGDFGTAQRQRWTWTPR
ncbi:MAG TPA: 2'-5' RNA ligase family protein [Chloroflexota bacterium]